MSMIGLGALPLALLAAAPAADEPAEFSETIVVTGSADGAAGAAFETRHRLGPEDIDLLGASSSDEIIRRLPAVQVPTNSRGESIAFMRNAAERQVAIFFEGADINVPWDNRLDLSLVPSALIGSVRTAAGPLAPHYGVNALGAISISARDSLHALGLGGSADLFAGEIAVPLGPVVVGGSYTQRDGDPLADDAVLPFSQTDPELRTNTDRELGSVFASVSGNLGAHDLRLTAFHVWGEKGIAPESNRASGARFWRYPDIEHTLIAANAKSQLGPSTRLDSAFWYQRFGQTIENYSNAKYERITLRQVDKDRTFGVRELLMHEVGPLTLVGSANFLTSTHRQRDIPFTAGNPPATLPAELLYRQHNWSVGGELEYAFTPAIRGELGIGYDKVDYARTGDKPGVKAAEDWTGRAGLVFEPGDGWRLRAAVGRKMRAPTLRERFGEAINRFLPNPDLKPEEIVTAEVGVEWRGEKGGFYVIPFIQDLKNTIDQHNVGSLRQRINLVGSEVQGVELGGEWSIHPQLTASGNATWTHVRRKSPAAGTVNRIAEKPSLLARARLDYQHPVGIAAGVEVEHVGSAYSADPSGALVPLEKSTSLNTRLAYGFDIDEVDVELFLHVDNVTDTFIEPQLGLPAPGRSWRIGFRIG